MLLQTSSGWAEHLAEVKSASRFPVVVSQCSLETLRSSQAVANGTMEIAFVRGPGVEIVVPVRLV